MTRSPSSALLPCLFWGEVSPTKIDKTEKTIGYLFLASLPEDLANDSNIALEKFGATPIWVARLSGAQIFPNLVSWDQLMET